MPPSNYPAQNEHLLCIGRTTALDKRIGTGLQGSENVSTTRLLGHPESVEEWMLEGNLRWTITEDGNASYCGCQP